MPMGVAGSGLLLPPASLGVPYAAHAAGSSAKQFGWMKHLQLVPCPF